MNEKSTTMNEVLHQSDDRLDVVTICQKLIQAKSYSGEEENVAHVIIEIMKNMDFDEVEQDRYGNVIGIITGNEPGPTQVYDAHIDTVPVADSSKWTFAPFSGEIHEGKVYGRGASDMKGALAAMLVAANNYSKQTQKQFKGRICVAGVVHEECFEGVAAREITKKYEPDYVIIGEASSLNVKHGQRGRAEIVIETFGKPAHSANPQKGINAVYHMAELINRVKQLLPKEDLTLGKGIMALTDIISSPYPGASVIPDYCKTTWDRRLLVGETKESVLEPIQQCINELGKLIPELKANVRLAKEEVTCYTGEMIGDERFFPAWYYETSETFVDKVHKKLLSCGFKSRLTHYDFCTNGSHYAGEAKCKTLGFGPSEEFIAHIIDEFIEIDQLEQATEGYGLIMDTLQKL